MNLIRRFLSGYTENFLLAVTLWPLAFNVVLFMPLGFIAGRFSPSFLARFSRPKPRT